MDRYGHLFPNEWDRLAEALDQTHRAALEGYQSGYQSDDENGHKNRDGEETSIPQKPAAGAGWF